LVNISKRRAFWSLNKDILKINDSDNQYAVSIKEDTAYPCMHSPKTTKERSLIRRIQRSSMRRIQDIVCKYSGRCQMWSLLQETPIRRIQSLGYATLILALYKREFSMLDVGIHLTRATGTFFSRPAVTKIRIIFFRPSTHFVRFQKIEVLKVNLFYAGGLDVESDSEFSSTESLPMNIIRIQQRVFFKNSLSFRWNEGLLPSIIGEELRNLLLKSIEKVSLRLEELYCLLPFNEIYRKGLRASIDNLAYREYGMRLMLAPRLAKALHEKALLKLHGIRKLHGSPSLGGTLF
ncbi:hypothetical protein Tco_0313231, partial [Tanacetum coccineum]